jgi:uncharacterized RDD family membrane protein YckC
MMQCQNCGQALPGAAVICRNCNFNNALQALDEWRHKRQSGDRKTTQAQPPTIRRQADATLIQFPAAVQKSAPAENIRADASRITSELTTDQQPDWREQLNGKLRQIRQQREVEQEAAAKRAARADINPIVAAAIQRLKNPQTVSLPASSLPASGHSTPSTSGANAVARAIEFEPVLPSVAKTETPAELLRPAAAPTFRTTPVRPEPGISRQQTLSLPVSESAPSSKSEAVAETIAGESTLRNAEPRVTEALPVPIATEEKSARTFSAFAGTDEKFVVLEDDVDEASDKTAPIPQNKTEVRRENSAAAAEWSSAIAGLSHSSGRAPVLARIAAGVVDLEVIAFSCLPFFTAFTLFNVEFRAGAIYLLLGIIALMAFAYHYITISQAGRTCGMAVFRLRLATADDEKGHPDKAQCLRRAFGSVLSLALIPLNLLVVALSADRRSLTDRISSTVTVRQ